MAEPTDDDLWRCVGDTLRHTVLAAVGDDEWAKAAVIQLIGLAEYAVTRSAHAESARVQRLRELLGDDISPDASATQVWDACGALLADSAGLPGMAGMAGLAGSRRAAIRTELVAQLDADLAVTMPLIPYFRGQLDA